MTTVCDINFIYNIFLVFISAVIVHVTFTLWRFFHEYNKRRREKVMLAEELENLIVRLRGGADKSKNNENKNENQTSSEEKAKESDDNSSQELPFTTEVIRIRKSFLKRKREKHEPVSKEKSSQIENAKDNEMYVKETNSSKSSTQKNEIKSSENIIRKSNESRKRRKGLQSISEEDSNEDDSVFDVSQNLIQITTLHVPSSAPSDKSKIMPQSDNNKPEKPLENKKNNEKKKKATFLIDKLSLRTKTQTKLVSEDVEQENTDLDPKPSKALTDIPNIRVSSSSFQSNETVLKNNSKDNSEIKESNKDQITTSTQTDSSHSASQSSKKISLNASKTIGNKTSSRKRAGLQQICEIIREEIDKVSESTKNLTNFGSSSVQTQKGLNVKLSKFTSSNLTDSNNSESSKNKKKGSRQRKRSGADKKDTENEANDEDLNEEDDHTIKNSEEETEIDDEGKTKSTEPDKLNTLVIVDSDGKFIECFQFTENDYKEALKKSSVPDELKKD